MKPSVHIFYIPGLGDHYDSYRMKALRRWNRSDVIATLIPMRWSDQDETFLEKQSRIDLAVQASTSDRIVLVGESAGGAVAISTFLAASSEIEKVITVCGKNKRQDRVAASIYRLNPAFRDAMVASDEALENASPDQLSRITTFYSKHDPTIRPVDTLIKGAKKRTIPMFGHFLSITFVLYVMYASIVKEALRCKA